ncbi:LLM class flavin-dependent oxidoreductase [soil metagenome]
MSPYLGVALDGAGWHPAAWRTADARPTELFSGRYWRDLVQTAERGDIDLVTFEDALGLQTQGFGDIELETGEVRGRLDALLIASFVAPSTSRIGLVPTVTVTHTEPFHVSTALATLDYASEGRAGWRPVVSGRAHEAAHFGRREVDLGQLQELFDEAGDAITVVRGLWDSWDDDAVIRDHATGRFLDNSRVQPIHFVGDRFTVRGPSISPRPPQGQPLVTILAHQTVPYRLAAQQADIVYITPHSEAQVVSILDEVRQAEKFVSRTREPLSVWADVIVGIAATEAEASARLAWLDGHGKLTSDALVITGTARTVADRLLAWHGLGIDGFRLRPLVLPTDLTAIVDQLAPLLAGARNAEATTLRERLGFPALTKASR